MMQNVEKGSVVRMMREPLPGFFNVGDLVTVDSKHERSECLTAMTRGGRNVAIFSRCVEIFPH